jgi:hypothetical protein
MILLDFSGSIFAAIHTDIAKGEKPNKEYIRHIVINTIRFYNKMFRDEYGLMNVILDSSSWRDEVFKQYKFERRKNREADDNEWSTIFEYIFEIQEDIRANFPFPVIQADQAEADDVIGYMAKDSNEPVMIVSNDKDFGALLQYSNVSIYRPIVNGKEKTPITNPVHFEFELIICGDKADGVPSVRCDDDFYVNQHKDRVAGIKVTRAPPVSTKLKKAWWEAKQVGEEALEKEMGAEVYNRYLRNRQLISLDCIPERVEYEIRKAIKLVKPANIMKALAFMQKNRMSRLAKEISDFNVNRNPKKKVNLFDL